MIEINENELSKYLSDIFGSDIEIKNIKKLGEGFHALGFSIDSVDKNGKEKKYILKTLKGEGFGHDYPADRASVLIRSLMDYNLLPNHIKSINVGSIQNDGKVLSIGNPNDFFIILEEGKGKEYWNDLDFIREEGVLRGEDKERVRVLARYLAKIHSIKYDGDSRNSLYRRVVRDFVGHGELTMGVIDTFPNNIDFVDRKQLIKIVKKMVDWWDKIKDEHHRLTTVHGDFYPGNILFDNDNLIVLDRSRFRYGEPADDTTCLIMNFINYSVMSYGDFRNPFKEMVEIFFKEYFEKRKDSDMFKASPLFFGFRGIVCIHPIFYSKEWMKSRGFKKDKIDKINQNKKRIINFIDNVLEEDKFEINKINKYLSD
jgi:hypothetical protein